MLVKALPFLSNLQKLEIKKSKPLAGKMEDLAKAFWAWSVQGL